MPARPMSCPPSVTTSTCSTPPGRSMSRVWNVQRRNPLLRQAAPRDWAPVLDLRYPLAGPLVGLAVGLVAGAHPARRAGRLAPARALRGLR